MIPFHEPVYHSVLQFWVQHGPENKWWEQSYNSAGVVCEPASSEPVYVVPGGRLGTGVACDTDDTLSDPDNCKEMYWDHTVISYSFYCYWCVMTPMISKSNESPTNKRQANSSHAAYDIH